MKLNNRTQQQMNDLPRVPGARGYFTPGSQGARSGGVPGLLVIVVAIMGSPVSRGRGQFPGAERGGPGGSSHLGLLVGQVYVYILLSITQPVTKPE